MNRSDPVCFSFLSFVTGLLLFSLLLNLFVQSITQQLVLIFHGFCVFVTCTLKANIVSCLFATQWVQTQWLHLPSFLNACSRVGSSLISNEMSLWWHLTQQSYSESYVSQLKRSKRRFLFCFWHFFFGGYGSWKTAVFPTGSLLVAVQTLKCYHTT